jgi:hypothetical protein
VPHENFPVEALYRRVPLSAEQSPSPSWKKPRETESCVVEAKVLIERFVNVEVPLVAVMVPAVSDPIFAVGPEEEPVSVPVTFPKSVPLMVVLLRTTRLVVVAVPETTSCDVDALEDTTRIPVVALVVVIPLPVAVIFPAVSDPMFAAGPEEEPVTFPVMLPDTERFDALMFDAVMLPAETPRKVEVPLVAVKLNPVMEPKTSSTEVVVVLEAPTSTWAEVVEGR